MCKALLYGLIALVLLGLLTEIPRADQGELEWVGTVYIRFDGRVEPSDAPVLTYDGVVYTLTGNIASSGHGIVVERDNVILEGAGRRIRGGREEYYAGVYLFRVRNVTVRNVVVENSSTGFGSSSALIVQ
ncbi:MAG: hypothetical protein QXG48_01740 [Thermofilaceae archaeon]